MQYDVDTANDRLQVVIDRIDGATAEGTLEIYTTGYATLLATFVLPRPCGTVPPSPGRQLVFDFPVTDNSPVATGAASVALIKDGAGVTRVNDLSVGTSGTDIVLNTVNVQTGVPITLTSGVINHP